MIKTCYYPCCLYCVNTVDAVNAVNAVNANHSLLLTPYWQAHGVFGWFLIDV